MHGHSRNFLEFVAHLSDFIVRCGAKLIFNGFQNDAACVCERVSEYVSVKTDRHF